MDRSEGPTTQPPTTDLVELRPGRADVAPCFFIHDREGETLRYRNLAQRLPDGVPAYGIEPRRAENSPTIHTTIEAMAQDYVHRIRKAVPHGPYVLFGLRAGGVLAHEVGRRLHEAGVPVAFVGIADAATPDAPKTRYETTQRASEAAEALKEADPKSPLRSGARASTTLVRKANNLLRHGVESKLTNVREWTQIALTEYTQDRQGRFLAPLSFSQIFDRAMDRHKVTPWPCPGVLFKSTEEDSSVPDDVPYSRLYKDPDLGWRLYCTEGLEVLDCPGGHTTLLREPYVQAVAERLARLWDGGLPLISKEARHPKVLAVIVNYKTAELSLNNARSVAQARRTLPNLELVVVENDSGDEQALKAGLADPMFEGWAHLHVEPANGGFSKGNNSAIRPALKSDHPPDYVLLLNPDAELRPGAAQTLVDFMEQNPSAGIAGPLLENGDGTDWNIAFRFPNLASEFDAGLKLGVVSRLLEPFLVARVMGDARSTIDWIPGAAMIIRRQVFHDAGLMDDNYFLYFEETDFCRAAKKAGWECWYVPDARVVHIAGQSTGVTVRDAKPKRLPGYWFESRRRYFVKNHGEAYAAACDAAHLTGLGLHKLRSLIQRRDDELPPKYMQDLWSHSVLMPRNRKR